MMTQTTPVQTEDMERRVAQYVQVRDILARKKAEYEDTIKPLLQIQEELAGRISAFLSANKLENVKTKAGTAYTSVRYTASLADPDLFMRFVIDTQKFDLLDRRANVTAVKDYVKEKNELPPGCNLSAIETVGVQRKSGADHHA